jgi:hypothetical protein
MIYAFSVAMENLAANVSFLKVTFGILILLFMLLFVVSLFLLMPCVYLKICLRFLKGEGDYPFFSLFASLAKDEETKQEMKEQEAWWGVYFNSFFILVVFIIFFIMIYLLIMDSLNKGHGVIVIMPLLFAEIILVCFFYLIVRYFRNYWKREERKKFTVGEKYIISYSNIDQLKEEIKGWLNDNKMNIIQEDHRTIGAVKTRADIGYYDLSIIIKLIPNVSKTIIIFDKNLARNYPIINFGIKKVLLELRRNLIRKLNGREEIKINLTRFFVIDYIFLFVVFLPLGYLVFNKYVVMERLSIIWGSMAISYPLVRRLWFSYKVEKQASLPEYYIEEYNGDVDI